jgi:hypothetical protein
MPFLDSSHLASVFGVRQERQYLLIETVLRLR